MTETQGSLTNNESSFVGYGFIQVNDIGDDNDDLVQTEMVHLEDPIEEMIKRFSTLLQDCYSGRLSRLKL